jgi:ABC-type bacteriocin/lantibiotic exporter with double-glycine peptidase domain
MRIDRGAPDKDTLLLLSKYNIRKKGEEEEEETFLSIISLFFFCIYSSFSSTSLPVPVCCQSCLFLYGHQCRNAIQTQSSESTERSAWLNSTFFSSVRGIEEEESVKDKNDIYRDVDR